MQPTEAIVDPPPAEEIKKKTKKPKKDSTKSKSSSKSSKTSKEGKRKKKNQDSDDEPLAAKMPPSPERRFSFSEDEDVPLGVRMNASSTQLNRLITPPHSVVNYRHSIANDGQLVYVNSVHSAASKKSSSPKMGRQPLVDIRDLVDPQLTRTKSITSSKSADYKKKPKTSLDIKRGKSADSVLTQVTKPDMPPQDVVRPSMDITTPKKVAVPEAIPKTPSPEFKEEARRLASVDIPRPVVVPPQPVEPIKIQAPLKKETPKRPGFFARLFCCYTPEPEPEITKFEFKALPEIGVGRQSLDLFQSISMEMIPTEQKQPEPKTAKVEEPQMTDAEKILTPGLYQLYSGMINSSMDISQLLDNVHDEDSVVGSSNSGFKPVYEPSPLRSNYGKLKL
ncbi:hypothetical protein EDD86DRAFT_199281 [Gorgonomyces haynaldii]|nr:hypothetical protein EDD86DRAFT_199281 [Gorgonomyces haynaldii]